MTGKAAIYAQKKFRVLHPDNQLNALSSDDRQTLWAYLLLYKREKCSKDGGWLIQIEAALSKAMQLEKSLRQILDGESIDIIPGLAAYKRLPELVSRFASETNSWLNLLGKKGYRQRVFANLFLVVASEFIRLRTRGYFDQDLAEMLQLFDEASTPDEISAEAIHKTRKRMQRQYPDLYRFALSLASPEVDQSHTPLGAG